VKFIVDIVYYIIPNMELFNLKDKVFSPEGIFNPIYLGLVLAYSLLYIAITLSITSVIFEKKEF